MPSFVQQSVCSLLCGPGVGVRGGSLSLGWRGRGDRSGIDSHEPLGRLAVDRGMADVRAATEFFSYSSSLLGYFSVLSWMPGTAQLMRSGQDKQQTPKGGARGDPRVASGIGHNPAFDSPAE